jgi:Uma2 family endonuclease
MSTIAHPPLDFQRQEPSVPMDPIFRLSVDQYHEMIRSGILRDDDQVELLEGWLVPKMSKNPPHRVATELAAAALRSIVPPGWYVSTQEPVTTSTSEPEPDLSVVKGGPRDYIKGHPQPEHLAMVMEIADSSLSRDRGIKLRAYAYAGVPVYWLVDVTERRVEVCTLPTGPAENPAYGSVQPYAQDDLLPVVIGGREAGRIAVRDILP